VRGARLSGWADSLPEGLDTPVGEHGAQLSGGQRQRLDEETADALTGDLLAATAERTVLLITHRPVPAAQVDQVLRLTAGRLAEIPFALSGELSGRGLNCSYLVPSPAKRADGPEEPGTKPLTSRSPVEQACKRTGTSGQAERES
jgi:hypothetical protein